MKKLLPLALMMAAPAAWATCPATYAFPGSNVPLNSSDWTQTSSTAGGVSALYEFSGVSYPTTASTQGLAFWVGSSCTPGDDQFAEVVLASAITTPSATGPTVENDAGGDGYVWLLSAGGNSLIYKLANLAGIAQIASCPATTIGHTYHLESYLSGGTLYLTGYENGVAVCSGSDASPYTGGKPGFLVDRRSGATDSLSNFRVGVSPPPPIQAPVAAWDTAVFVNTDGIVFNLPSVGNPTIQIARSIQLSPSNVAAVVFSNGSTAPIITCWRDDGTPASATTPGTCDANNNVYTWSENTPPLISIPGTTTISFLATASGVTNSNLVTNTITVDPMYPYPAQAGVTLGAYSYSPLLVTLNGALIGGVNPSIIYTTDGSTPAVSSGCTPSGTGTSVANNTTITLPNSATTTVKFIPCSSGTTGAVQSGTYTQQAQRTAYIRPDGGTRYSTNVPAGQCDGFSNVAYPGTGTNQHCAFNDFRFLWDDDSAVVGSGEWVIAGGDNVIVTGCTANAYQENPSNPDCRIGWDINTGGSMPSNQWCWAIGNDRCFNPTIPSGSVSQPTQFLGANYAACATGGNTNPRNYTSGQLAQIFGGFGLTWVFNLQDTQNINIECMEFTTHNKTMLNSHPAWSSSTTYGVGDSVTYSGAVYGGIQASNTNNIPSSSPTFWVPAPNCVPNGNIPWPIYCNNTTLDDYAKNIFLTDWQTANIKFQDVSVHGAGSAGLYGPFGAGITMTRVDDSFNFTAGWQMDDGNTTPDGPNASFAGSYVTMTGNGCYEQYPIVNSFAARSCYSLLNGGFGDGFSGQDTRFNSFTCDHCQFLYQVKDATPGPHPLMKTMTVTNSQAIGMGGADWKWISDINGTVNFYNNLSIGNCFRYSLALPGASQSFYQGSGLGGAYVSASDLCRGAGMYTVNLRAGVVTNAYNNTFVNNQDWDTFYVSCGISSHDADGTCATAQFNLTNNAGLGYTMSGSTAPFYIDINDSSIVPTVKNQLVFGMTSLGFTCGTNGNLCSDPLFVGEPPQTPNPTSWAFLDGFNFNLTSGSPAITAGTTPCPSVDYVGNSQTSPCTIGALIFSSSSPVLTGITVTPNPGSVIVSSTLSMICTATYSSGPPGTCVSPVWTDTNTHSTINSSTGVVTGTSAGSDTVTATIGSISGNATVNVSSPPVGILKLNLTMKGPVVIKQ